jgi:hypothetical protein
MKDAREQYENYISRRSSSVEADQFKPTVLIETELNKYLFIRDTIQEWLKSAESKTEKDWQEMILTFLLLIFPKYVAVLENVKVEDAYSNPGSTKDRFIDILLVDASGNVDVIEIKKPFEDVILAKSTYRDNNVPTRELSGTIMQAEKYIFHLSKWGLEGENKLTKRYASDLPSGLRIQITNPKAIVILGRDRKPDGSAALSAGQLFDLEIIKRKYANMIDIMTYDDLLRRLDNIISSLQSRATGTTAAAS